MIARIAVKAFAVTIISVSIITCIALAATAFRDNEVWPTNGLPLCEFPFTTLNGYEWVASNTIVYVRQAKGTVTAGVYNTLSKDLKLLGPFPLSTFQWSYCVGNARLLLTSFTSEEQHLHLLNWKTGEVEASLPVYGSEVFCVEGGTKLLEIIRNGSNNYVIVRSFDGLVRLSTLIAEPIGSYIGAMEFNVLFLEVLTSGPSDDLRLLEINVSKSPINALSHSLRLPEKCEIYSVVNLGEKLLISARLPGRTSALRLKSTFPFVGFDRSPGQLVIWSASLDGRLFKEWIRTSRRDVFHARWMPGGEGISVLVGGKLMGYTDESFR